MSDTESKHKDPDPRYRIAHDQLTRWAESCLRINGLGELVRLSISTGALPRATHLTERARRRAWVLFNEMIEAGGSKPPGYCEAYYTGDPFPKEKEAFARTQDLMKDLGLNIEEAYFRLEALGSWSIVVAGAEPLQVIWDGVDQLLVIQRKVNRVPSGESFWEDAWIARNPDEQTPERIMKKFQEIRSA